MFYMIVPVVWGTNPVIISFFFIPVRTNVPKSTFVKYDPFPYLNGEGVRGLMPQSRIGVYRRIVNAGRGVVKPSSFLDAGDHFLSGGVSPPDGIVGVLYCDAIGGNVRCDIGHGGLVVELTRPGHPAILEWSYSRPFE